MRIRTVFAVLGAVLFLLGLLWTAQGLGWVRWPQSSFMIDQRDWVWRGALTAVLGAVLILRNRRH
ncbi:hypothetical protein NYR55_04465 [Sphingomonas sp. BGYR3]|uniref:hypothetical protein n=1 Tax=Sphingomonas sp. BGYR3 TaxID=2975483 RepID=UPI0021A646F7|nr:hypothetical protein [Sphingomonas sp. BGYR3]MDG5487871.1 hypothetical protein [Sphingomonas sp. BGYR3]